ncbi:hypothetical protein [Cedecea sp. NFIX57]|uniref:hypothetical protein n=1 Tax=Cedecea sp. NFIX57 TaxID=1566286 RepID=UPI000A1C811F|nr:hypothetical protein [Cedecea sp. NFIX57]
MTHSSDAAALNTPVFLNAQDIQIETLEVDFPESSERDASIFGNGENNIPVRVRFKFLDKSSNNKDISESLKKHIYLYDVSVHKGIRYRGCYLWGDSNQDLFAETQKNSNTLGFYGKNHATRPDADSSDVSEVVFYVKTENTFSVQKEFKLGAYLALNNESTPGNNNVSSGDHASVGLTVMPAIDYTNPSAWKVTQEGMSDIPLHDNMILKGSKFYESAVTGKSVTWKLRHSMLQDNTPLRLTVESSYSQRGSVLKTSVPPVASSQFTQEKPGENKHETSYNAWIVPHQGQGITIQPYLPSEHGSPSVEVTHPVAILSESHGLNHNTQDIFVIQASIKIQNDDFTINTVNTLTGTVVITDNVGHNQHIQVICSSQDGKPTVTGKG